MKILPAYKRNKDILFHLETFARNGRVYPEYSTSQYIQKVINEVKMLSDEDFKYYVDKLVAYVRRNNIEFKYDE